MLKASVKKNPNSHLNKYLKLKDLIDKVAPTTKYGNDIPSKRVITQNYNNKLKSLLKNSHVKLPSVDILNKEIKSLNYILKKKLKNKSGPVYNPPQGPNKIFNISVEFQYYRILYSKYGGKTFREPNQIDTISFKISARVLNILIITEQVKEELKKRNREYVEYHLVKIIKYQKISEDQIRKNATYDPKKEPMWKANISFSWIPDVKFKEDGICVYNALASIENGPKIFKDNKKLLKLFQKYEDEDIQIEFRDPKKLTLESGVCVNWIQRLCIEFNITHYALDYDNNYILKYVPDNKSSHNYQPICYIHHDNHMHLIIDKSFINKLSYSSTGEDNKVLIKMIQDNEKEDDSRIIDCDIFENIEVNELDKYKNCVIIYSEKNIEKLLLEIYEKDKIIYKNYSMDNKIIKIIYKNNVIMMTDPNIIIGHCIDSDTREELRYTHVKELCEKYKIPFRNQSITALIRQLMTIIIDQKNKDSDDEYYKLPEYASVYNSKVYNDIISTNLFKSYAFIERLDGSATKHKNYYIDCNKCRRNIFIHLKEMNIRIPVFTCMDHPKQYNGEEIKEGSYFIETDAYFPLRGNGWYFHFQINYFLSEGIITKDDIKFVLSSSLSVDGDYFNDLIKILVEMPYGLSKAGTNFLIGMFNKTSVEINKMHYTTSFRESSTYYMNIPHNNKQMINYKDNGFFKIMTSDKFDSDYYSNIIYNLIVSVETIEMHKLFKLIKNHGGHPTHLNTDCIECWFNEDKPIDLSVFFWDKAKTIPKYKYEEKEEPPEYERMKNYKRMDKFYLNSEQEKWTIMEDNENDDFDNLAKTIIEMDKSINIDGIAGSGKSFLIKCIMKYLQENGYKYHVLAPTNKACRKLSKNAKTIHKFLGVAFHNTATIKKIVNGYDYIIIDEVSMMREIFYSIFENIKKINPKIKFILAGDWRQCEPVNDRAYFNYEGSYILKSICDFNQLLLTKCRRSNKDLYNLSINIPNINLNSLGKIEYETSICYTNKKRKEINNKWLNIKQPRNGILIQKIPDDDNSQDFKVYKGLPIISIKRCTKYEIEKSDIFIVKFIDTKKKQAHIICENDDIIEKIIPIDEFGYLFYVAYCITTHKAQGDTIDKPYTIYEWKLMDEKLKYTALTRSTKKEYLNIFS